MDQAHHRHRRHRFQRPKLHPTCLPELTELMELWALETMPTMTMMCLISWRTLTNVAKPKLSAVVAPRPIAWKQTRKTQKSKWCGSPQTFSHTLQNPNTLRCRSGEEEKTTSIVFVVSNSNILDVNSPVLRFFVNLHIVLCVKSV